MNTTSHSPNEHPPIIPCTLGELIRYFLWLGASGFGGPIALIGYMQRDLVEHKRWFSPIDYIHGMALAQICPGPLATQLAIYLGWLRFGASGATLVGISLILPSFMIVIVLTTTYIHYGSLPWTQGAFYGIGASVIAVIARSSLKLFKIIVDRNSLLILFSLISAALTIYYQTPFIGVIILSGLIFMGANAPPKFIKKFLNRPNHLSLVLFPTWMISGINPPASNELLLKILGYFIWAGAFIFGSGLAIIPFLHGGVVDKYHWLTEQQFLDAIAIGLITPGPALITVAFIGFLVAGFMGATLATLGIFFPSYLFVLILAPHYQKIVKNQSVQAFVKGMISAIAGSILGSIFMLGEKAIVDIPTVMIFGVTCVLLFGTKKIPEPLIIIGAGVIGILMK